jgi:hypothetical protein
MCSVNMRSVHFLNPKVFALSINFFKRLNISYGVLSSNMTNLLSCPSSISIFDFLTGFDPSWAIRRVVHTSLAFSKLSTRLNPSLSTEELRMVMACVLRWIFCSCSRVGYSSSSGKSTPSQTTCHTSGEMDYK